jgi:uncharacterized coiled-coil DUF342 family protein
MNIIVVITMLCRDEFVTKYLDTRHRLNERLNEVYKKIADHKRQRDEMAQKLAQVNVSINQSLFNKCSKRRDKTNTESWWAVF